MQKFKLETWHQGKMDVTEIPPPTWKCSKFAYVISLSEAFEITMNILILINVVFVIFEMVEAASTCRDEIEEMYGDLFTITNFVFIGIYFLEAAVKVGCVQRASLLATTCMPSLE